MNLHLPKNGAINHLKDDKKRKDPFWINIVFCKGAQRRKNFCIWSCTPLSQIMSRMLLKSSV